MIKNETVHSSSAKVLKKLNFSLKGISPTKGNPAKYEEHKKKSDPILSNAITPFEAFQGGFESAIASYLKLGHEAEVKNIVVSQVQPKSEETQLLETLIKSMLKDFNSVKFIKNDERYLALADGKVFQFSSILERVNFNQIELTASELEAYHQLLAGETLYQKPYLQWHIPSEQDFKEADPEGLCSTLSLAEKEAINIYTGSSYGPMNNLLRGNIDQAIDYQYLPGMMTSRDKINHGIKETLLHIAVAVSGLNKLPDYVPPPSAGGEPTKYLYRAEGDLPESILSKRKWAVKKGGGITTEMGFLSTSYLKPAEGFFSEYSKSAILVRSLKGKKITPLSQFGNGEREILLPPTQMQWQYHKDIITDLFKNTMALFIARPVTVAPELAIDYIPRKNEWLIKKVDPSEQLLFEAETAIA